MQRGWSKFRIYFVSSPKQCFEAQCKANSDSR